MTKPNKDITRRRYIQTGAVVTTLGVAGCLGDDSSDNNTSSTQNTGNQGNSQNENKGSNQGTTVEYLTDRGGAKDYFEKIKQEFEKENPGITVNLEFTSKGVALNERLAQRVAAGNPPDIIFIPSVTAYQFAAEGNAVPVTDINKDLGLDSPTVYQGEDYLVPAMRQVFDYWYRTDLYPETPTTFQEWLQGAKAASEKGDAEGFLALNGQTNIASTTGFSLVWGAGAQVYSGSTDEIQVVLDQGDNKKKVAEALSWYSDIHQYSPNAIDWGWGDSYNALARGTVAAAPGLGSDPALTTRNNNEQLVSKLAGALPPKADGTSPPLFMYAQGNMIHSAGKNPEAAKKFTKYFNKSSYYLDWLVSDPMYLLPYNKKLMDDPKFTENEFISNHMDMWNLYKKNWGQFKSILNTGSDGAPNLLASKAYNNQILGSMLSEVTVKNNDPAKVVTQTANKIRELKDQ